MGREITVSPNHPFIGVTDAGVEQVPARNVDQGLPIALLSSFSTAGGTRWQLDPSDTLCTDGGTVSIDSTFHDPKSVKPLSIDPEVARFLALTIAEAQHDERFVAFANKDPELRDEYERLAKQFGLEATTYEYDGKTPIVRINSKSLVEHLRRLDCPPGASREVHPGSDSDRVRRDCSTVPTGDV
ncbi:LAGLIDADG family homing endonuclease [Natronoarchaeum sp. GCM10025703]|uniref:LAGLIDADG family homing endonuclease n=1 Tax=Natronoarchaeum sp. GCM10025703 TaxID=3252685 RepID=UPI00361E303B